jgi:hypothetical protein
VPKGEARATEAPRASGGGRTLATWAERPEPDESRREGGQAKAALPISRTRTRPLLWSTALAEEWPVRNESLGSRKALEALFAY